VQFLEVAAPPDLAWFSIETSFRPQAANAILRGRGQKAGTPDMAFVWQGRAAFHELKSQTGKLSPAQKAFHEYLRQAGAIVEVIRSPEACEAHLRLLGVPLRASLTPNHNGKDPR
jgi:hypothetical protein